MLVEDGLDDGLLGERLAGLEGSVLSFGLVVVDVEAQDVPVFDGVGDGVGVQLLLEEVLGGLEAWPARPRSA